MEVVLEQTTAVLSVQFKDETGAATVPQSAFYRIDDVQSGSNILPETEIVGPTSTTDIVLTDTDNRILSASNAYELRSVLVRFVYAMTKVGRAEYRYYVKNMANIG